MDGAETDTRGGSTDIPLYGQPTRYLWSSRMDIQLYGRTGYKGRADLRTRDTGPMDIAELPAGRGHLSPGGTEQRPRLGDLDG